MKTNSNPEELEPQGDQRQPAMHEQSRQNLPTKRILSKIKRIINFDGLEVAREEYRHLCYIFSDENEWSNIAQAVDKLFEQEIERLSPLVKKPSIINYGPYYEIQTGGNHFNNQGLDDGDNSTLADMSYQANEEEQCGEREGAEEVSAEPLDEDLVMKLKSIFYNNVEDARKFLREIHGMASSDITDLVNQWVDDKRISNYGNSRKGVLWRILHDAGLYPKSRTNWNGRVK